MKRSAVALKREATLDELFSLVSSGTRRRLLLRLLEGEATVGELTDTAGVTMPAVTRHLQQMERAGVVVREKRGRERVLRLETGPLRDAIAWLRGFHAEGSSLADYLNELREP